MKKRVLLIVLSLLAAGCSTAEIEPLESMPLSPGFNPGELPELLEVCERMYDPKDVGGFKTPQPKRFKRVYRSPVYQLENRFDIWLSDSSRAAIAIRGTILDQEGISFAEDFYALMVPAEGEVQISDSSTFEYKLAEIPDAGVHLGFLLGLGTISKDLLKQVNLHYSRGIEDFYILGHSQGAGVAYLATAHLRYLQKDGALPADIRFKTYCIAAPKVGNLLFAYDYEKITQGGWAFSIQNTADWVPTAPMTIQGPADLPPISPLTDIRKFLTEINYPPGPGFEQTYQKFLRATPAVIEELAALIRKYIFPKIAGRLPGYVEPGTIQSFDYERMGVTIPLIPNRAYYRNFPNDPKKFNVWENHSIYPYYWLVTNGAGKP